MGEERWERRDGRGEMREERWRREMGEERWERRDGRGEMGEERWERRDGRGGMERRDGEERESQTYRALMHTPACTT